MLPTTYFVFDSVPGLQSDALIGHTFDEIEFERIERNIDDHGHVVVSRSGYGSDHLGLCVIRLKQ